MVHPKIGTFEIVLLFVGVAAALLGFQMINQLYSVEREVSWLMIISIFNWLMLLVLFISLSITVDVSKKQLAEMKNIADQFGQKKGKK